MPHKQWESEHGMYRKLPEVLFAKTELNIIYGLRKNETKQKKQNKKAVNSSRMLLTEHVKTHDGTCM